MLSVDPVGEDLLFIDYFDLIEELLFHVVRMPLL